MSKFSSHCRMKGRVCSMFRVATAWPSTVRTPVPPRPTPASSVMISSTFGAPFGGTTRGTNRASTRAHGFPSMVTWANTLLTFRCRRTREGWISPKSCDLAWARYQEWGLEPELHPGLEAEVALAVVAAGEIVAEAGEVIIGIDEADGELGANRDVNATADGHRKSVVAGGLGAANSDVSAAIRVEIAVCSAEKYFGERFQLSCAVLDLRTKHVGEKIALRTTRNGGARFGALRVAAIALQIGCEAEPLGHIEGSLSTAAVEVLAIEVRR